MHINKNTLKIGSILLALCLLAAWLPVMVSALGASLTDGLRASAVSLSTTTINGKTYYQIGTADDLYAFASLVNGGKNSINAILMADIVVNENVLNEDGSLNGTPSRTWTPIGSSSSKKYAGIFDGNGHTISGLYCVKTGSSYTGLFGYMQGGKVMNVGVLDSYFKGEGSTAGVLGYNANGTVQNCYNGATVIGGGTYVGGVVGNNGGLVTNCYNTGIISGTSEVGGITGRNTGAVIGCYHSGSVTSTSYYTGAVIGCHSPGILENCYYLPNSAINGKNIVQNGIGNSKSNGTTTDSAGVTTSMTAEQFASGEVAWLLQSAVTDQDTNGNILQIWGQNIGTDPSPTLSEYMVYRNVVTICGESTYRYANAPADPVNTHDYQVVTTAPTCTEAGVKTYSCACGESYSEAIAATGHNYENGVCTGCGDKKVTGSFTKSTRSLSLAEYVYINQYVYIEGFDGIDLTVYGGIISWIGEIDEDDAVVGNDALTIRAGLVLDQKTGRYAQQSAVIWANQYGKTVYMRFYVQLEDGTYVYSDIYSDSVGAYCQAAFASTKVSHDNKQAYAAMLYYGAAAQVQFDHATTGLVSDYIPQEYANKPEWDESRIDALRAVPSYSTIATSDLVIRRSNTLSMVEAVGLNCYFYVHESISVKSAQLIIWNGSVSELTLKNTAYVVDMDKVASKKAGYTSYAQQSELIYANRLGDTMFISARIEAEDGTVYYSEPFAYSPEFYASTAWAASSVSADSKELAMCMVWYGECVKKLFG